MFCSVIDGNSFLYFALVMIYLIFRFIKKRPLEIIIIYIPGMYMVIS